MKALLIAWKDTLTRFRDWKALVSMLAAPILISALIGLAFGNFSSTEAPVDHIPVALVNLDGGQYGQVYEDALSSSDLNDLLDLETTDKLDAATQRIQNGELRAVVFIPAGFSDNLAAASDSASTASNLSTVQVFTDPSSEVGAFIVDSLVRQISARINSALLAGRISAAQVVQFAPQLGSSMANLSGVISREVSPDKFDFANSRLDLNVVQSGGTGQPFDVFSFFIPGMAVFFLMFTMFEGPRSVLIEQAHGTLGRLMTTPTSLSQIILGKMGGTFFTGVLQFAILILVSKYLFNINWGDPLGVISITLLTVFAAAGLGSLLTLFAHNENQAGIIASAVALVFGALGGSFFPASNLSGVVDIISKLTINRWAMDAFIHMINDKATFIDILPQAGVLAVIGAVTFLLALQGFKRRFVV